MPARTFDFPNGPGAAPVDRRFRRIFPNKLVIRRRQELAEERWKVLSNKILAYIRARRFCICLWQHGARRRLAMHVLIRRIDVSDVRLLAYKEADILRLTPIDVQPNNHLSIERRSFDRFLMSCFEKHDEKVFGMIV